MAQAVLAPASHEHELRGWRVGSSGVVNISHRRSLESSCHAAPSVRLSKKSPSESPCAIGLGRGSGWVC